MQLEFFRFLLQLVFGMMDLEFLCLRNTKLPKKAYQRSWLDLKKKKIALEEVGEELFRSYLYHPHFPDPDLLIRTGGDCRVSNFLLWEVAYSEIIVRDEFWPEFTTARLREAISQFGQRERRFGKTSEQVTGVSKSQDLETV